MPNLTKPKYDVVIIGAGLFGATCAFELTQKGLRCLVVDQRFHIGGNCHTENRDGINLHTYGAHIFHTNNHKIWQWINQFASFNNYKHRVQANYRGEHYSFPLNLLTFKKLWGVQSTEEAQAHLRHIRCNEGNQSCLESWIIGQVGNEVYEKFIKGYTEKQWGRPASELPASIVRRLPIRFTENNNYFDDRFQGIPVGGYTPIFEKLLHGINRWLGVDYFSIRQKIDRLGRYLLYTGPIDRFFDYRFGRLGYRSLRFENQRIETKHFQDAAVINYTDVAVPYTRIIEHKHFEFGQQNVTWISYEFPAKCSNESPPYYPVKDALSQQLLAKYKTLLNDKQYRDCFIGGRLGEYQYYDMHQVIAAALKMAKKIYERWKGAA